MSAPVPSESEEAFENFLRSEGLHASQSPAGYALLDRVLSRSTDTYQQFVSIDLGNRHLRSMLPRRKDGGYLFRIGIPAYRPEGTLSHTTSSTTVRAVDVPGSAHLLPITYSMEKDLPGWFQDAKNLARSELAQAGIADASNGQITAYLAFKLCSVGRRVGEEVADDLAFPAAEVYDWIGAKASTFLLMYKFIYKGRDRDKLTLQDGLWARKLPISQLASLYLPNHVSD